MNANVYMYTNLQYIA